MTQRTFLAALAALALLAGALPVFAQQQQTPYGTEEYNAYIETTRAQTPQQRVQLVESFLQKYPESVLRAYVYPAYVESAFALKDYRKTMKAADAFLGIDREKVAEQYRQANYNDAQIDGVYYRSLTLYVFSFLQSANGSRASGPVLEKAARHARTALEMHRRLYANAQPPEGVSQQQFEQVKKQEESAFHGVLALAAWTKKDFRAAAEEYAYLIQNSPQDANLNYQLGESLLRKEPPSVLRGIWHVARAVAFGIARQDAVKQYLTRRVAAYQQVVPSCIENDVAALIQQSRSSLNPPAGWSLISADQVNAVRQEMNVKRIFDDLQAGGETARVMWLAACGTEIGIGEDGQPELTVLVLDISSSPENSTTLRVAAGQEAAEAKTANMEVVLEDPESAKPFKADDIVRVSGQLSSYQSQPQFLLRLTKGKVRKGEEIVEEVRE